VRLLVVEHQDDAGPGVFSEAVAACDARIWRPVLEPPPSLDDVDAALVLGAAANVHERETHPWIDADVALVAELVERSVPTLGVCLGAQLLATAAGGSVRPARPPEIGWYDVALEPAAADDPVVGGVPSRFESFQWHSYEAVPPPGATVLARSAHALQAFRLKDRPAWGIQFHAEVSDADAAHWIEHYEIDPDAVAMGLDPETLARQTEARMPAWHELGRGLFDRFLAAHS
jgi:GMP synthase (glutamine-hydrolysing)